MLSGGRAGERQTQQRGFGSYVWGKLLFSRRGGGVGGGGWAWCVSRYLLETNCLVPDGNVGRRGPVLGFTMGYISHYT